MGRSPEIDAHMLPGFGAVFFISFSSRWFETTCLFSQRTAFLRVCLNFALEHMEDDSLPDWVSDPILLVAANILELNHAILLPNADALLRWALFQRTASGATKVVQSFSFHSSLTVPAFSRFLASPPLLCLCTCVCRFVCVSDSLSLCMCVLC